MSSGDHRDHQEVEIKLALRDAASYELARAALGAPSRVVEQVNHYYETSDGGLRAIRGMLRVREGEGAPIVTLKLRPRLQGGLLEAREVEEVLDPAAWEDVAVGRRGLESLDALPVRVALDALPAGARLLRQGTMRNRRSVHPLSEGLEVELDRTELPDGTVDHEVEVETDTPADARPRIVALLDGCGAHWEDQPETKYQRFLAAAERARA